MCIADTKIYLIEILLAINSGPLALAFEHNVDIHTLFNYKVQNVLEFVSVVAAAKNCDFFLLIGL